MPAHSPLAGGPSIFAAVQEQLGLKLVPSTVPPRSSSSIPPSVRRRTIGRANFLQMYGPQRDRRGQPEAGIDGSAQMYSTFRRLVGEMILMAMMSCCRVLFQISG